MFKISKLFTAKVAAYFVVIALGITLIALIVVLLHPVPTRRDTCKTVPDLPLEVSFDYSDRTGTVVITWTESYDNKRCDVTYQVGYSIDGGDEWVTYVKNHCQINALETCSFLQVRIRAVNKFGDITVDFIERNYTLVAKQLPVVYIEAFDTAEGVTVTWQAPPELLRCNMQYSVTAQTERGTWSSEIVDVTSMNIPWYAYCMSLPIVISSWANRKVYYKTYYHHISDRTLEGIEQRISPEDPEELFVSWRNDAHQNLCHLVYDVSYFAADPALQQMVVVTTGEARFRFVYCMNAVIVIRTIKSDGVLAGPQTYFDATQYPKEIADIQGYTVDISQENVTIISWLPVSTTNQTCNVTYRIQFTSDLGDFTYSDVAPPVVLPKPSYCFVLGIELQVLIGEYQVNSAPFKMTEGLHKVHGLEFAPSIQPDTLLLEWSEHSKKEACGLSYEVTYQYGSHFETFTTNQSSIILDTIYCANISIAVAAVRGDSVSEKNNITTYTGPPNIVGEVQNIAIVAQNGTASVSWDSPRSVSQCNILYNVTAIDVVVDVAWCAGTSNCRLNLTGVCPSELVITASYLDEEPIIGEPSIIMYNCW